MWARTAICVVFAAGLAMSGCKEQIAGGKADGAAIFADACARCHGPSGAPEPAMEASLGVKNLTTAEFRARATPEYVRHRVTVGSDNRIMPPFSTQLSAEQLDAIVQYVLTLSDAR